MDKAMALEERKTLKSYFLSAYDDQDFMIKAKAIYTFYLALALLAAAVVPFALMFFSGFAPAEAAFRIVALVCVIIALALLRAGKSRAAANFLVGVSEALLCVFLYLRAFQHYYELYALAFLLEATILMACLVGRSRRLPVIIASVSYALVLAFYFVRTARLMPAGDQPKAIESLFFIALFLGLSGFVGTLLMRMIENFTGIAMRESERNKARVAAMGAVVDRCGTGWPWAIASWPSSARTASGCAAPRRAWASSRRTSSGSPSA